MKRCTVCGEIVADDVTECPVCHAKTFAPVAAGAEEEAAPLPEEDTDEETV